MIRLELLELLECRLCRVELARVELELRLREQDGGPRFRRRVVRELEPVVAPHDRALRLCGPGREQVARERRVGRAREKALRAREIPLDQMHQAAADVFAAAPRAPLCHIGSNRARQPDERDQPTHGEIQRDEDQHETGHRHFDDVAAEIHEHVAAVLEHEVRDERAEQHREQGPEADTHLATLRGELAELDERRADVGPLRIDVEAAHLA